MITIAIRLRYDLNTNTIRSRYDGSAWFFRRKNIKIDSLFVAIAIQHGVQESFVDFLGVTYRTITCGLRQLGLVLVLQCKTEIWIRRFGAVQVWVEYEKPPAWWWLIYVVKPRQMASINYTNGLKKIWLDVCVWGRMRFFFYVLIN